MTEGDIYAHYDEIARRAAAAMQSVAQLGAQLAAREVEERSADGRVVVRVTAGGSITEITLRNGALRRYDSAALGELVTKTLQSAQRRARADYQRAIIAAVPDEVAEATDIIASSATPTYR